ncbi:hypothetical protein ACLOJK_017089 [Asimina triloba]
MRDCGGKSSHRRRWALAPTPSSSVLFNPLTFQSISDGPDRLPVQPNAPLLRPGSSNLISSPLDPLRKSFYSTAIWKLLQNAEGPSETTLRLFSSVRASEVLPTEITASKMF